MSTVEQRDLLAAIERTKTDILREIDQRFTAQERIVEIKYQQQATAISVWGETVSKMPQKIQEAVSGVTCEVDSLKKRVGVLEDVKGRLVWGSVALMSLASMIWIVIGDIIKSKIASHF